MKIFENAEVARCRRVRDELSEKFKTLDELWAFMDEFERTGKVVDSKPAHKKRIASARPRASKNKSRANKGPGVAVSRARASR